MAVRIVMDTRFEFDAGKQETFLHVLVQYEILSWLYRELLVYMAWVKKSCCYIPLIRILIVDVLTWRGVSASLGRQSAIIWARLPKAERADAQRLNVNMS